jgi:hypothetical protein
VENYYVLGFWLMGANGKPKTYELAGGAMVTPDMNVVIKRLAKAEERPIAFIIRKLIEESPRMKAALNGKSKERNGNTKRRV